MLERGKEEMSGLESEAAQVVDRAVSQVEEPAGLWRVAECLEWARTHEIPELVGVAGPDTRRFLGCSTSNLLAVYGEAEDVLCGRRRRTRKAGESSYWLSPGKEDVDSALAMNRLIQGSVRTEAVAEVVAHDGELTPAASEYARRIRELGLAEQVIVKYRTKVFEESNREPELPSEAVGYLFEAIASDKDLLPGLLRSTLLLQTVLVADGDGVGLTELGTLKDLAYGYAARLRLVTCGEVVGDSVRDLLWADSERLLRLAVELAGLELETRENSTEGLVMSEPEQEIRPDYTLFDKNILELVVAWVGQPKDSKSCEMLDGLLLARGAVARLGAEGGQIDRLGDLYAVSWVAQVIEEDLSSKAALIGAWSAARVDDERVAELVKMAENASLVGRLARRRLGLEIHAGTGDS